MVTRPPCYESIKAALGGGAPTLYGAPYIAETRASTRALPRRRLRQIFYLGTGQQIPPDVNLRNYVAKWNAHQQAINAGETPSPFWRRAVGVTP